MTTDEIIGERVHQEMWRQRVSQVRLASGLGITQTAVSRKLRGNRPWFASELVDVAEILGVPVSTFYGDQPSPFPPSIRRYLQNGVPSVTFRHPRHVRGVSLMVRGLTHAA